MSGRPETRTITESEIEELARLLTEAVLADTMRREHGRPAAAISPGHPVPAASQSPPPAPGRGRALSRKDEIPANAVSRNFVPAGSPGFSPATSGSGRLGASRAGLQLQCGEFRSLAPRQPGRRPRGSRRKGRARIPQNPAPVPRDSAPDGSMDTTRRERGQLAAASFGRQGGRSCPGMQHGDRDPEDGRRTRPWSGGGPVRTGSGAARLPSACTAGGRLDRIAVLGNRTDRFISEGWQGPGAAAHAPLGLGH